MKQFVFLCGLMVASAVGGLVSPFWAVLGYYTLAVLRPQYLWDWALPLEVRWSMIAAVLTLLAVAMHAAKLFRHARLNATVGLMGLYGVLILGSVIPAYDPQVAQSWATDFAKVLLIALIATLVIEHHWQVRMVAAMIGLCLGYIAYEINFYYFFQNARLDVFHNGYGGLDNNGAGLMLALGLPFAYCFALSRDWRVRLPAIVAAGVLSHAVMLTYSRGAMLAAVVGLAWLAWHHRPRWQLAVVAPLVVVALMALAGSEVRQRFMSMRDYHADRSAMSRFDSWSAAWQIAWEHPVTGAGLRNSNRYSQNYGADFHGRTTHNQYLQIAADSGIPAAAVYTLLLGLSIWRLSAARRGALRYRSRHYGDADDSDAARELVEAERLCLATQTALVIFAFGGVFLSLETFELAWLLIVVAGVLPGVVKRRLAALEPQVASPQKAPTDKRFTFAPPIPKPVLPEPAP